MLTTADLTAMQTTAGSALPDSCVIQTQAWNSDGGGGGTTVWSAAGTVDCRLAPMGATEGETGGRISADAEFMVTMPHDAAVTTNSRLLVSGGTFHVAAVRDRSWELVTRAEVVREV